MFAQFLDIVFKSLKLDKNLYKDSRYFGEAAIYFAGLIMILDGVAGAVAANTIIKTSIGISGINDLTIGKYIELKFDNISKENASRITEEACKQLLVNSNTQSFTFEIIE